MFEVDTELTQEFVRATFGNRDFEYGCADDDKVRKFIYSPNGSITVVDPISGAMSDVEGVKQFTELIANLRIEMYSEDFQGTSWYCTAIQALRRGLDFSSISMYQDMSLDREAAFFEALDSDLDLKLCQLRATLRITGEPGREIEATIVRELGLAIPHVTNVIKKQLQQGTTPNGPMSEESIAEMKAELAKLNGGSNE